MRWHRSWTRLLLPHRQAHIPSSFWVIPKQYTTQRGEHNIDDELVFSSNPSFVFHDSCGFESGSEEEVQTMRRFISERANTGSLDERLHAIWFVKVVAPIHWLTTYQGFVSQQIIQGLLQQQSSNFSWSVILRMVSVIAHTLHFTATHCCGQSLSFFFSQSLMPWMQKPFWSLKKKERHLRRHVLWPKTMQNKGSRPMNCQDLSVKDTPQKGSCISEVGFCSWTINDYIDCHRYEQWSKQSSLQYNWLNNQKFGWQDTKTAVDLCTACECDTVHKVCHRGVWLTGLHPFKF